jgi:hypothetical protein
MIFAEGKSVDLGPQTNIKALQHGREYVFDYQCPPGSFAFISPNQMKSLLKGWVNLRKDLDVRESGEVFTLTGVQVNTGNNVILVRGSVMGTSSGNVNPWAVASIIASLFSAIGVGISLLYVYNVVGGPAK